MIIPVVISANPTICLVVYSSWKINLPTKNKNNTATVLINTALIAGVLYFKSNSTNLNVENTVNRAKPNNIIYCGKDKFEQFLHVRSKLPSSNVKLIAKYTNTINIMKIVLINTKS